MRNTRVFRRLTVLAMLIVGAAAEPKVDAPYGITPADSTRRHPIDLPTVLRLVDSDSPAVGLARARYREAVARLEQAELLWIPNLAMGTTYLRHDGNTQNQLGLVFGVSRSSLFAGGAAQLRVDTADAYFQPLVARRVAQAESHLARATTNNVQYEAASAYLDLLQAHAGSFIVADTLARAEQMLQRAEAAVAAGVSKTAGDANRARAEVNLRRQEAQDFLARAAAATARLTRILGLTDTTEVEPAEETIVPITLVPTNQTVDDLVLTAWASRPEMAAQQAFVAAAAERLRQARLGPLFPKVQLEYSGGSFGGGGRTLAASPTRPIVSKSAIGVFRRIIRRRPQRHSRAI
jgi:outer membrane protein TolC